MRNCFYKMVVMLIILAVVGACAKTEPEEEATVAKEDATLFDRLGGMDTIPAVINDFVDTVGADERIKSERVAQRLEVIDFDKLKALLTDQVCMGTGGPCEYRGRSMKEAHAGLGISDADFDYVVGDLVKTLNKYKVPEKEKNELLAILGPMRSDIVEVK